jgi:hypothetical protein
LPRRPASAARTSTIGAIRATPCPDWKHRGHPVERAIILGLTRQESEFNTVANSHAGARGLMQLMPGTAKMVARQHNVAYDERRLTSDPAYNVMLGAAHFGDLINNYNGSYILSLVAYNAGPRRVREWIEMYGDPRGEVDPIDWVESVPFTETRKYIQIVMQNVHVYRSRLDETALPMTADLVRGGKAVTTDLARGGIPAKGTITAAGDQDKDCRARRPPRRASWRSSKPAERRPGRLRISGVGLPMSGAAWRDVGFRSPDGLDLYARDYRAAGGRSHRRAVPVGAHPQFQGRPPLAERIGQRRRVIAPDYRGRGRSAFAPDWSSYRVEVELADAIALLDRLGLDKVVVVGTSRGGLIAMLMAALHRDRLAGVRAQRHRPGAGAGGTARGSGDTSARRPRFTTWRGAVAALKRTNQGFESLSEEAMARLRPPGVSRR